MRTLFYDELNLKSGGRRVEIRGPIDLWAPDERMLCVEVSLSQDNVPSTPGEAEVFPEADAWETDVRHPSGRYAKGPATVTALYELELASGSKREWTWSQQVRLT